MQEKVIVQLPNLVASLLAETIRVNEHYAAVSQASREWLGWKCSLSGRDKHILHKGDFAYFCALNAPYCGFDRFKDFGDWVNWVFPFDDFFDNGELKGDPEGAGVLVDNLLGSMHGNVEPRTRFVCAHQDIWERFKEASIELPDYVFDHALVKEIETLGVDWVLIQNDLISYPKDEEEGVNHNLIASYRLQVVGAQEAYDQLGSMLEEICTRFDTAVKELPCWGEGVDGEVARYVEGIKNCVKANLHWSFRTDRYFGSKKDEVKVQGRLAVLKEPPYLANR